MHAARLNLPRAVSGAVCVLCVYSGSETWGEVVVRRVNVAFFSSNLCLDLRHADAGDGKYLCVVLSSFSFSYSFRLGGVYAWWCGPAAPRRGGSGSGSAEYTVCDSVENARFKDSSNNKNKRRRKK